jgi:hypothetical protein
MVCGFSRGHKAFLVLEKPDSDKAGNRLGLSIAQNDDPGSGRTIRLAIAVLMNRQMLPTSHL